MRRVFSDAITIVFVAAIVVLALYCTGCSKRTAHSNPPLFTYDTPTLTSLSAYAHARDVGGTVSTIAPTGSMEPLLTGGDLIVVAREPFSSILGKPAVYWAEWSKDSPVCHRAVGQDGGGYIMAGDNVRPVIDSNGRNIYSEASYGVTENNYVGVVVGIYRHKP